MTPPPFSQSKFGRVTAALAAVGFLIGFTLGELVVRLWIDALQHRALPLGPDDLLPARIRFGIGLALLAATAPLAALIASGADLRPRIIAGFSAFSAVLGIVGVLFVRSVALEMVQESSRMALYALMIARSMPLIELPVACSLAELLTATAIRVLPWLYGALKGPMRPCDY